MTDQLRAAAQAVLDRWDSPKWEWAKQGPTADLMAALRAALAQQAEPFTPDAIRTTQTAWKMGYDAAKAETQQAEPAQKQVMLDALVGGTGVTLGGKRIDPASIYKQAEPVAFDWPRKACPCRDVQNGECLKLGCKWERDPSLVPEALRRQAGMQQAEPVEPVAKVELMMTGGNAGLATRIVEIDDHLRERLHPGQLLYTAPPQRKPLTDDEILEAVGWERAEMLLRRCLDGFGAYIHGRKLKRPQRDRLRGDIEHFLEGRRVRTPQPKRDVPAADGRDWS